MLELHGKNVELIVDENGGQIRRLARPGGPNVLAVRTWATPIPPSRTVSYGDDRIDYMAGYDGGWLETFPNFGTGGTVLGVPVPFHGDVARSRWTVTRATGDSVEMQCDGRLPVVLSRRIRLAGSAVLVEEVARADADVDVPVLWGHHPVFPAYPGVRIDLPGGQVESRADWQSDAGDLVADATGTWPDLAVADDVVDLSRVPPGPIMRLACVRNPPGAWAAIRDPASRTGVALSWDADVFRNVWIWLESGGTEFPWYGRARFLGIEPQSAASPDGIAAAIADGTALTVPAGGELSTWLTVTLFDATDDPVVGATRSGDVSFAGHNQH